MGKLAIPPVTAALLLFAAVTLVGAQQPPFPPEGGTVEVEYANRIFALTQNPELLQFARMFRETVCINLTMTVEDPQTFREGSNYKINCLPWLMNFPGGSITWFRSTIIETTGVRGVTSIIDPEIPPAAVEVGGPFNSLLNITSTLVSPAQQQTTAGIYTCEVCIGGNKGVFTLEELREDGQCHNASVVTFNIGGPPIVNDTTPDDTSFDFEPGQLDIRSYRVGSSPCLSNPPNTMPPTQGGRSPDPANGLRIQCGLLNEFLNEDSEFPRARPPPIRRRWYFNGVLVYDVELGQAPTTRLNPNFTAMFPSLDPDNNLVLYDNAGFIQINTNIGDAFVNQTDLSFAAVYGNWTCSLRNDLGTDVARFGTILRECGEPPLLPEKPENREVLVTTGDTITIGCIGCVITPPGEPILTIDCTPTNGTPPFRYEWSVPFNETENIILEDETGPMLRITEEGTYRCAVSNADNPVQVFETTIIGLTPRLDLSTTIQDRFGENLTDNGCSRLRGPSNATTCTLIGDTLHLVCSSVNPTDRVFILTPDGDIFEANGTVSVSHPIEDTLDAGIYSCNFMDALCGLFGPRIMAGVYQPATINRAIDLPAQGLGAGRVVGEQIITPGSPVTLYCPFKGIDEPVTTWRVIRPNARGFPEEIVLDDTAPGISVTEQTIDGVSTLVLAIDSFNGTETYVCRTKNIAGIDAGIVALRTDTEGGRWITSEYSACNPPCQRGVRTRQVTCVSTRDERRLPQLSCDPLTRPPSEDTEACEVLGACFLQPRWKFYPWSPCSRGCSGGVRRRVVRCVIPRTQQYVDDSRCAGQRRPPKLDWCFNTCCTRDRYYEVCRRYGSRLCRDPRYQQNCCWTCGLTRIP